MLATATETQDARRRRRLVLLVGLPLVVVTALGTVAVVQGSRDLSAPSREDLCAQYDVLVTELTGRSAFSTQAVNRAARKLSQQAERYEQESSSTAASVASGSSVADAGRDIRGVLGAVAWESPDLLTATRPIALECGWSWPISSFPPAPAPQPPAS